jgi:cytochrome c oxidase subunit 2
MLNFDSFVNLFKNVLVHIQLAGNTQIAHSDAATPWQLGFQDPATPTMEGIINFHNDLMFFIVAITAFVGWLLFRCIYLFSNEEKSVPTSGEGKLAEAKILSEGIYHNTFIEVVWTVVPALILAIIAVPSFALLYSLEELVEPNLTLKVTGNQWYWSYEYSNCRNPDIAEHIDGKKFDAYMIPTEDLEEGNLRLLEVDNRVLLPVKTHISVIVTASRLEKPSCPALVGLAIYGLLDDERLTSRCEFALPTTMNDRLSSILHPFLGDKYVVDGTAGTTCRPGRVDKKHHGANITQISKPSCDFG